ncbi:TRAP transporter small permease subunit [Paracoccus sp. MBLB3053]|uniref:TRAP transporter small permease protein n=1 Tax=Paracoccus aurantius TaxID=3073814 RepID=A0ABU2HWG4_9RHOB|nr:TRAP transporter small permease subunit [Paracoccus sp. MBLB3053]MDS9469067.1 TRAP transporter small permease subunit [Paracoccus sp. MBLB3053]
MSDHLSLTKPASVHRVLDMLSHALLMLTTGLMLLILALLVAQVAARNIWQVGLPRAEEISRLAGVLAVYLTAPVLALRGQHVAVDVFTGIMPRLPKLICRILAELSTLAFSVLSVWGGWLYLQRAWKFKTPALGLQNIWLFTPVMIALALLAVISVWRLVEILRGEETAK